MAGRARLSASRSVRFAALVALVLVVHWVALERLSGAFGADSRLKPMASPMFTRLLVQQAPAAVASRTAEAVPVARRPSVRTLPPRAAAAAQAASAPARKKKAASAPSPAPAPEPPTALAETAPDVDTASSPQEPAPPALPPSEPAATEPEAPAALAQADESPVETSVPEPANPMAAADPQLDSWPADSRLTYRLAGWFRGEFYGDAQVQWHREGTRYQVRVQVDIPPFTALVMTSQGEVSEAGLLPAAYEETRRTRTRAVQLTPEWVVLNDGRRVSRPAGVQDAASQFVELTHRFITGRETLEVGRTVDVWLARPNAVDLWTYDIVARETLQTERLGAVEAYRLKPRPIANPRGNITVEMWFAPTLQYLPVRIRLNVGESYLDLTVDTIEQR